MNKIGSEISRKFWVNILFAGAGETMPIRTTNKILSFENIKNLCNFEGTGMGHENGKRIANYNRN